jgi:hypothetical protein
MILGSTINEMGNCLDQVSAYPILFQLNCLILGFSVQCFSIRGHKLETRVYVGCISLGHIHNHMYVTKVNPSCIYEALYVTSIKVTCIQLHKQVFLRELTQNLVFPLEDGDSIANGWCYRKIPLWTSGFPLEP